MKLEDINRISSLDNDFLSAYRVRFSKYCQAVRKIKLIINEHCFLSSKF